MDFRRSILVLSVVGLTCQSSPEPPGGSSPAATAGAAQGKATRTFKVALLSPGPISDGGWNASAYEGLRRIESELNATIAQVETKTPPEFEAGFREYAAQGFDLVFGHGFEFQDAAAKVAGEFPGTVFVTSSGSTLRDNLAPMVFRLEEATYLLGMVAGLWPGDGRAGVIGGMEIPSVESTFVAFEAGYRAVAPERPVLRAYVGSWEDVSAAKEATLAQIRQGANFVMHNADAAGLGVLRAVSEASTAEAPVYAFGTNRDQAQLAPDVVLASAVLDVPAGFVQVAREVRDGTFQARVMELGMADGIVSLVWNPALADRVPADVRERVEAARQAILEGTLLVPKGF